MAYQSNIFMARIRHASICLLIGLVFCVTIPNLAASQQVQDWTGEWQTFWRTGQAVISLHQEDSKVKGTYEPGGGTIEAEMRDGILYGTWKQRGAKGGITFALAGDGQTFTGRYDNGEYWNGRRVTDAETDRQRFSASFSPHETLRSVITLANEEIYEGTASVARFYQSLLWFEGQSDDTRERNRRRILLWQILDMSTFRIFEAPERPEGNVASYPIRPAGGREAYLLQFRLDDQQRWRLVVESEAALQAALDRMLTDLGYRSLAELQVARRDSPRTTMRNFIQGVAQWESNGKELALATLDLSFLSERLRDIEGPIIADYLTQIINRAGYVIWQEIPDDPAAPVPYVHYRHPLGSVVIERVQAGADDPGRWLFSRSTLLTTSDLFGAMQTMPLAQGLTTATPFTEFFRIRQQIRNVSPVLLERSLFLENWQWAMLVISILIAIAVGWISGRMVSLFFGRVMPGMEEQMRAELSIQLDWPVRVAVGSTLLFLAIAKLGLAVHTGEFSGTRLIAVMVAIAVAFLLFRLFGIVGGYLVRRAALTPSYVDEIVASLATGLAKLLVVIFGLIICADIVGLPYEGVIAGLGVGGIALAFAARDTVSNMLAGALLMTDRPFKRGDLVETDGQLATIMDVGLRSTRLMRPDDTILIIPNAQLSDKAIINWGMRQRRRVDVAIGLTYDTPRDKLDDFVQLLGEVFKKMPDADPNDYYIGLKSFGPSSIDIDFRGFFKVATFGAQVEAQHRLIGDIVDLATELGVSFAFPTRTVHIVNEDA